MFFIRYVDVMCDVYVDVYLFNMIFNDVSIEGMAYELLS